jgi:hypothetical protein
LQARFTSRTRPTNFSYSGSVIGAR